MTQLRRAPALDGVRGLALGAVLLFHGGVAWAVGGHLGVTVFFALSGFLITSLLLHEQERTGAVALGAFWARRAKRLVPALIVALGLAAAVAAWTPDPSSNVLGDAVATLTWSTNWWFIAQGTSYADLFHDPSPLQHTWSLAVEEQYYLLFPLLVLVVRRRAVLAGVVVTATVASVLTSTVLADGGSSSARLHYGTDTRVAEILVGALLALALHRGDGWRQLPRRVPGAAAAVGGLVLVWLVGTEQDDSRFLQHGGWALVALATCSVLVAAVQEGSVTSRVLGVTPLVWLGQVSYGAYLYHWPLFLLIDETSTGLTGPGLLVVRLAATLGLAQVSLSLLELPVRESRLGVEVGLVSWGTAAGTALLALALATGTIRLPAPPPLPPPAAVVQPQPPVTVAGQQPQRRVAGTRQQAQPRARGPVAPAQVPAQRVSRTALPPAFAADPAKQPVPAVPASTPSQLRVAVIGDSLGDNLGKGLQAWARSRSDVVVYDLALPGCPLSRGGERRFYGDQVVDINSVCGWWDDAHSERRKAFDAFGPELVVSEDGVNELFDRRLPDWSDWRSPGQLPYDNWLVDEYTRVTQHVDSAKLLVLNTPCADWDRYDAFKRVDNIDLRVRAVNTDQQRLTGVTRGDLMSRLCPNGKYSDSVEGVPNGRPDGLHLSDEAARRLARDWLGPLVLRTGAQPATGLLPP